MLSSNDKFKVFFDDHCGVCAIGSKLAKNKVGVDEEGIQKLSEVEELNQNYACQVDPQKACNELAVVEKETNEVQYGWSGIKALIAYHQPTWKWPHWSWMQSIYYFVYKNIAFNRRVIAPVKITENTCTPERSPVFSNTFLVGCLLLAFGASFIWYRGEFLTFLGMYLGFQILELLKTFVFYKSALNRQAYFNAQAYVSVLFQLVYACIHWSTFFVPFYLLGLIFLLVVSTIWMKERLYFSKRKWLISILWVISYLFVQLFLLDQTFQTSTSPGF